MRCLRSLLAISTVLLIGSRLIAQNPAVLPRIAGPVDEKSRVVLTGNVPSVARAEFDRGPAPAATQLSHVRIVLARSGEQQAALDKYDADLLDKASPNYHQWLTPQQFGKLYGPTDSDIAAVVAWLESHGVRVDPVAPGRTTIAFSGTVQQIEEMLQISIHSFEINGEQFYANTGNPTIPAALVPVVSGVARLNTLRPRPQHVRAQSGLLNASTGRVQSDTQAASRGPRAELTGGSADNFLFLVAGDAATIYNTPNSILNANFATGGTNYTGTGVTIGIGGDSTIKPGTVANYRSIFVGDTKQPLYTNVNGTTFAGNTDEAYIDNELSGALAPGATIHYYTGSDLGVAIDQMLTDDAVDIFSLSFGACELDLTTSDNATINAWWQQAATQGIAVTVSTGDDGSAACDNNNSQQTANAGLFVSGFASTPYNIGVGGTDFGPLLTSFSTYVSPSASESSTTFYRTAKKYIPEWTWNDSTTVNTTLSQNKPYKDPNNSNQTNIVAGSGGKSSCTTNTTFYTQQTDGSFVETRGTCSGKYAKPFWQRGTGVPADSARDIPDISLMGGAGGDAAAWAVCTDDKISSTSTIVADCSTQSDGFFHLFGFGGTSTSAPAFAGILAMAQQKAANGATGKATRLGQAAQELYNLYNGPHASAIFHDITIGNISVPCDTTTTNCSKNTAGFNFLTGYDTTAGYDLATGIGSVDATQLITYWGTGIGPLTTTMTVTPSATTFLRTAPVTVSATIKGTVSSGDFLVGNPTGSVTLSGGGYTATAKTLTASGTDSATATFSIPASSLTTGTDTLTVSYAGDTNYASKTGTTSVTVTGSPATVVVVPATLTLNSSAALGVSVTVSGTAGTPSGTVVLTGGGYTSSATALDGTGKATINIPAFTFNTPGVLTLTATYSGDANFAQATGTAATVTVTVSTFTLVATDLTLTAGATTANASTVTVTPVAGYTGTVNLTAAVTSSPAGAVGLPTFTGSSVTVPTATTGTITVATSAATAASVRGPATSWFRAAGSTALAAFLLFFAPLGFRRGRRVLSVVLVLVAATFTVVGCGGGGGGGGGTQKTTPSVTVSPSKTTFSSDTAITVAVSVAGGTQTPTGTVTLTGGGFTGAATSLSAGAATFSIPANTLSSGSVTLTSSYSGDTNFNAASGTSTVTVNKPKTTAGAYTITVTGTDSAHSNVTATTTFTLTVN